MDNTMFRDDELLAEPDELLEEAGTDADGYDDGLEASGSDDLMEDFSDDGTTEEVEDKVTSSAPKSIVDMTPGEYIQFLRKDPKCGALFEKFATDAEIKSLANLMDNPCGDEARPVEFLDTFSVYTAVLAARVGTTSEHPKISKGVKLKPLTTEFFKYTFDVFNSCNEAIQRNLGLLNLDNIARMSLVVQCDHCQQCGKCIKATSGFAYSEFNTKGYIYFQHVSECVSDSKKPELKARVNTEGKYEESKTEGCPGCEGDNVQGGDLCDPCRKEAKDVTGFKALLQGEGCADSQDAEYLKSTFYSLVEHAIESIVTNLMGIYTYYWDQIEPAEGVLSRSKYGLTCTYVEQDENDKQGKCRLNSKRPEGPELPGLLMRALGGAYPTNTAGTEEGKRVFGSTDSCLFDSLCDIKFSYNMDEDWKKGPRAFSAFHAWALKGHFVSAVGKISPKIVDANQFKGLLLNLVDRVIWVTLYRNCKVYKVYGEPILDILERVREGKQGDDNGILTECLSYMQYVVVKLTARFINMIVVRRLETDCMDFEFFTEREEFETLKAFEKFARSFNEQKSSTSAKSLNAAKVLVYPNAGAAGLNKSEVVMSKFKVILNEVEFFAYPNFAYKPIRRLQDMGRFQERMALLGQTLEGDFKTLDLVNDRGVLNGLGIRLFAGSRAGKGVMTLALAGSLLKVDTPFIYFDSKPDMAGVFIKLQTLYADRYKELCAKYADEPRPPFRLLSFELSKPCPSEETEQKEWYAPFTAEVRKVMYSDQRNWRKDVKEAWLRDFGVAPPDQTEAWAYLFYTRAIMLSAVLTMALGDKKKPIVVMDEINTFTTNSIEAMNTYICKVRNPYKESESAGIELEEVPVALSGGTKEEKAARKQEIDDVKSRNDKAVKNMKKRHRVFDNFLSYFFSSLTAGRSGSNTLTGDKYIGGSGLKRDLNVIVTKQLGLFLPYTILIGQHYSDLSASSSWLNPFLTLLGNAIVIQGNWTENDAKARTEIVTQIEQREEAKAGFIHPVDSTTSQVSGFFGVKEGQKLSIVSTFLVLNENSPSYLGGEKGTVQRVRNVVGDNASTNEKLGKMLFKDFSKLQKSEQAEAINYIRDKKNTGIPDNLKGKISYIKEVGFPGYIKLVSGMREDKEQSMSTEEAERIEFAFLDKIAQNTQLLEDTFLNLAVAKVHGYKRIADFIYDTNPSSFVPLNILSETDVNKFQAQMDAFWGTKVQYADGEVADADDDESTDSTEMEEAGDFANKEVAPSTTTYAFAEEPTQSAQAASDIQNVQVDINKAYNICNQFEQRVLGQLESAEVRNNFANKWSMKARQKNMSMIMEVLEKCETLLADCYPEDLPDNSRDLALEQRIDSLVNRGIIASDWFRQHC